MKEDGEEQENTIKDGEKCLCEELQQAMSTPPYFRLYKRHDNIFGDCGLIMNNPTVALLLDIGKYKDRLSELSLSII